MSRHRKLHGPWNRCGALAAVLVVAASLPFGSAAMGQPPDAGERPMAPLAGRSLQEALAVLGDAGLKIVYTSELVGPDLVVEAEPTSTRPREILREILRPHGLDIVTGARDVLVVVRRRSASSPDASSAESADRVPEFTEELTVTPSKISLLRRDPVAPLALDRNEILTLPHLNDDVYRALSLLPGVSSNDVTAQFHVRGSRRDETQILLDGQELYDAYHLKDFDSALSLVSSSNLNSADLTTGGFAVEYGDRMSGVLDMTTLHPTGKPRGRVGVGLLSASAGGHGTFADSRGAWLAEVRRGTIDLASQLLGKEDPTYWDGYAKLEYRLGDRHLVSGHGLFSGDDLDFSEVDGPDSKSTRTDYDNQYAWLAHQAVVSDRILVESAVSSVAIDRDREGIEEEEDARFTVLDLRRTEILGLRQGWTLQASEQHLVRWGFDLRRLDTTYDYFADFTFDNPVAGIRNLQPGEPNAFAAEFEERHDSLYLSDQFRVVGPLSLDLGLRWDEHTQTGERLLSPRLNAAVAAGERTQLRLAWGRFTQSQRPYELGVEDGETVFQRVERSEHRVLGVEHLFRTRAGRPLTLRAEIYRREVDNPRPRYENLYEPLNTFPEIEPDRIRVDAERSVAEGLEIFVRGRAGSRLGWWVNYTYSTTEDLIEGRWTARPFDQRHAVNLDVDLTLGEHWRLNMAWRFHTGWPTTPLSLRPEVDEDGEIVFVPELGPLYSERLPDYHRLDLRLRRLWRLGDKTVTFFVDVQNLYDRGNLAGFDVQASDETGMLQLEREDWAGILPSIGIAFEF